jgi:ATP-dependent RNA circularization protein (DNA/RNA ligase family)
VLDGEFEPPYNKGQGTGKWLNRAEKESVCEEVGAPVVPLVWKGVISPEELPKLANRISSFGSKTAEGIVLKNYSSGVFGKFINLEFQQKISDEALQGGIHPMRAGIRNFRR